MKEDVEGWKYRGREKEDTGRNQRVKEKLKRICKEKRKNKENGLCREVKKYVKENIEE